MTRPGDLNQKAEKVKEREKDRLNLKVLRLLNSGRG